MAMGQICSADVLFAWDMQRFRIGQFLVNSGLLIFLRKSEQSGESQMLGSHEATVSQS